MTDERYAARLSAHNPRVRIIVMLRNPVDRAYSAYWYARRNGFEPLTSFEKALDADPARFTDDELRGRNTAYLRQGHYAEQLANLDRHFPREQQRIVLVEDLKRDAIGLCHMLFEFLGVDKAFRADTSKRRNAAAMPRSRSLMRLLQARFPLKSQARRAMPGDLADRIKSKITALNERGVELPPMDVATRQRLIDYYRQQNIELSERLQRDLSTWC